MRVTRDRDHRLELIITHTVYRLLAVQVLRLVVNVLFHAVRFQDQHGTHLGTGGLQADTDAFALEVGYFLKGRILADHDVDVLGIEVGNHPQLLHCRFAVEHTGAGVGPVGDVGLNKTGLDRATLN